jgi:hypothetical protein
LAAEAKFRSSETGVPQVRHEVAGSEVTVGVVWLCCMWLLCIAGCLACWGLVAWAVVWAVVRFV